MSNNQSALLRVRNLSFSYRALPVLRQLNWDIEAGQTWACVGPNGSGKTTLAGLISGQLLSHSGTLDRHPSLRGRGVATVCFEQQKALCERDRQLDDSEFRSDAHDPGTTVQTAILGAKPANKDFDAWTERLRMRHILQRGIRFISTGEMRKTLLLRAILSEPALLILDSPLDGLDRNAQTEMSEILEQLPGPSLNLLLLCRQLDDLPACVSHILALNQGQILGAGPRQAQIANPEFQTLMHPPELILGALPGPGERTYTLPANTPLLELHDVSVSYGDTTVLNGINWTLHAHHHCAISGPNGCGKSTLLSLVTGDNHKAYGQNITLFGRRRGSGESVWEIKQKYGVLDNQLHLNYARGMRVIEVVVSGFFDTIGLYDDWGDQQRQIAREWLAALGLAALETAAFDTLSFGLQRMVLLVRAMVKSPAILVLDEPCLGLDGSHRRSILRAIDHIANQTDTRIVYVSHSAGEMPACINQQLEFVPQEQGFELVSTLLARQDSS
jgi:molybdate transport system ATP-binding protein